MNTNFPIAGPSRILILYLLVVPQAQMIAKQRAAQATAAAKASAAQAPPKDGECPARCFPDRRPNIERVACRHRLLVQTNTLQEL